MQSRVRVNIVADPNALEAVQINHAMSTADVTQREWQRFLARLSDYNEAEFLGCTYVVEREAPNGFSVMTSSTGATAAALTRYAPGGRIRAINNIYQVFTDIAADPVALDNCANVKNVKKGTAAVWRWHVPPRYRTQHKFTDDNTAFPGTKPASLNAEGMMKITNPQSTVGVETQVPTAIIMQLDQMSIPPLPAATGFTVGQSTSETLVIKGYYYFGAYGKKILNV